MISFRVSDGEFEQLRATAEARGARSISDYVRLAVCGSPNGTEGTGQTFEQLSGDVTQLRRDIQMLKDILEIRNGVSAASGNGRA